MSYQKVRKFCISLFMVFSVVFSSWPVASVHAAPTPALTDDLVAYYQMEENAGKKLLDSSGIVPPNDADLKGTPVWVTGKVGSWAIQFSGTNEYGSVPNSPSLNITGAISISAWVRPQRLADGNMINKGKTGLSGYELGTTVAGKIYARFNNSDTYRVESVSTYPTDGTTWMHVAVTYDGTTIRLYINSVLEASNQVTFTIGSNTDPLGIASVGLNPQAKYKGDMDDVRIYSRVLTRAEVWEVAGSPKGVNLSITKDDGLTVAVPEHTVTYTIRAANAGPEAAIGATLSDTLPAGLINASWTCTVTDGAKCASSGSGNILDTINIPPGATVTYTLTATVDASAVGSISNTAIITAPEGKTDLNPADNTATDSDSIALRPEITALSLVKTTTPMDAASWAPVAGSFAEGYSLILDPGKEFYYLDVASLTANTPLKNDMHPFFLDQAALPAGYMDYWAAKGVIEGAPGDLGLLYEIITGVKPIFYLDVTASSNTLVDGFLYQSASPTEDYLRVNGDYPLGTYTFNGTLTSSEGAAKPATVQMTLVNDPPILDAVGNQAVDELAQLTFTAVAHDQDNSAFTYSLVDAPAGASIDPASGVFTWTPSEAQGPGSYTFKVFVSDGSYNDFEEITVTVGEVNVAPSLVTIPDQTVNEQTDLSFTAVGSDADIPVQNMTYTLNGSPDGASIDASTGVFSWIPTEAQGPGKYTFDVCANDGELQDCETIEVTVAEVNVNPVISPIDDKNVDELATLAFTAAATDADLPENTLTFSLDGAPAGAAIDASSGAFSWTPGEAQGPEEYTFDVCVSDGTATLCAPVKITVAEVNSAPAMAAIGSKTVDQLAVLEFTASGSDADLPAQTLSYRLVGAPAGAAINPVSGAFSWTPNEIQGPGQYTFDVCVSDGTLETCETIIVTVNQTKTTPVITSLSENTRIMRSNAFVLSVYGTGFVNTSKILWDGIELTTTFVSATELQASVPAAYLTEVKTAMVTVSNGVGFVSNPMTFTVSPLVTYLPLLVNYSSVFSSR